jgi:hypothetical protein
MHGDEVTKIRITQIRARYLPAEFAVKTSVRVFVGRDHVDVKIISCDEPTCFGRGTRRWLICPQCACRTTVISHSAMHGWFGCRNCWRYRSRPSAVLAPHARVSAKIDPDPMETLVQP